MSIFAITSVRQLFMKVDDVVTVLVLQGWLQLVACWQLPPLGLTGMQLVYLEVILFTRASLSNQL